jgi:hypothetical protein
LADLRLEGGQRLRAKLVVGADGGNSQVIAPSTRTPLTPSFPSTSLPSCLQVLTAATDHGRSLIAPLPDLGCNTLAVAMSASRPPSRLHQADVPSGMHRICSSIFKFFFMTSHAGHLSSLVTEGDDEFFGSK